MLPAEIRLALILSPFQSRLKNHPGCLYMGAYVRVYTHMYVHSGPYAAKKLGGRGKLFCHLFSQVYPKIKNFTEMYLQTIYHRPIRLYVKKHFEGFRAGNARKFQLLLLKLA